MKLANRLKIDYFLAKLIMATLGAMLTACGSNTPYLDSKFGDATQNAYQHQSIDNAMGVSEQMNARELRVPMDNYLKGTAAPAALQGVVTTGSGSAASR